MQRLPPGHVPLSTRVARLAELVGAGAKATLSFAVKLPSK